MRRSKILCLCVFVCVCEVSSSVPLEPRYPHLQSLRRGASSTCALLCGYRGTSLIRNRHPHSTTIGP